MSADVAAAYAAWTDGQVTDYAVSLEKFISERLEPQIGQLFAERDAARDALQTALVVDPGIDPGLTWPQYAEAIFGNLRAVVQQRNDAGKAMAEAYTELLDDTTPEGRRARIILKNATERLDEPR